MKFKLVVSNIKDVMFTPLDAFHSNIKNKTTGERHIPAGFDGEPNEELVDCFAHNFHWTYSPEV